MDKDPWTDPDPQPGDFDAYLANVDPRDVEIHDGNPGANVTVLDSSGDEKLDVARVRSHPC